MKFKINPKEESEKIPKLIKNLIGEGALIASLKETFNKPSKKQFYLKINKMHKENKKKFEKIKSIYQGFWKERGKKYLKEMERILGYKLKEDKVCYIVPSLWVNVADVIGRKDIFIVAESMQQNPLDFILFHELTHLYYADTLVKLKLEEAGESPLMEGVDHLILFKSPIKKLFSGKSYENDHFIKSNPKFMRKLEKLWENRKDFESFLKEAIKVQRKMKGIIIY